MKNLIFTTVAMIALTRVVLASSPEEKIGLDDHTFRQITIALRDDPESLCKFLKVAAAEETGGCITPPLVLASEQICLTMEDIRHRTGVLDFSKVFEVNLNGINFCEEDTRQKVVDCFRKHNLSNLRVLHLNSARGVSALVRELFGDEGTRDKFVSLFKIDAENTDIKNSDLDTVFSYLSHSTRFYRDIKQVSVRYDVYGAFLLVEVKDVMGLSNTGMWQRGKKTDTNYDVHYVASEESIKGPLIMRVEL
jgi:hypothetical protein